MTIVKTKPSPEFMLIEALKRDVLTVPLDVADMRQIWKLANGFDKVQEELVNSDTLDDVEDYVAEAISAVLFHMADALKSHALQQDVELQERMEEEEVWAREEAANDKFLLREYYRSVL